MGGVAFKCAEKLKNTIRLPGGGILGHKSVQNVLKLWASNQITCIYCVDSMLTLKCAVFGVGILINGRSGQCECGVGLWKIA